MCDDQVPDWKRPFKTCGFVEIYHPTPQPPVFPQLAHGRTLGSLPVKRPGNSNLRIADRTVPSDGYPTIETETVNDKELGKEYEVEPSGGVKGWRM